MREFQVHFTTKAPAPKGLTEQVVTEIGARNWKLQRESALEWLEVESHTFYVLIDERKIYVVAASWNDRLWLRTSRNWDEPNLLLNLPEFPPDYGKA